MNDFYADLIVADSEHDANMRYITQLDLPDDFIYLGLKERQLAIVSDLEFDRARANAPEYLEVVNQRDFGKSPVVLEIIKNLMARFEIKGFRVPYDCPAGLVAQLQRNNIPCVIEEKSFFPQRIRKKPFEVDFIREAMRANELAMQKALDTLKACSVNAKDELVLDGELFTSEKLRTVIDSTLAAYDAVGAGTIAAAGRQSAMPHNRGEGVIYAHTPIVIDIFPRMNRSGYFGDLTRTVTKGKAPEIVRRAFDAVKLVRDECKAMLKPGQKGHISYDHALSRLAELGFPTGSNEQGFYGFFHGLGHGVGLEIHEAPRLSRKVEHILAPGEVVTVEPGVYYPEWGGIRLEDLVVITDNGCECLTQIETVLELD